MFCVFLLKIIEMRGSQVTNRSPQSPTQSHQYQQQGYYLVEYQTVHQTVQERIDYMLTLHSNKGIIDSQVIASICCHLQDHFSENIVCAHAFK